MRKLLLSILIISNSLFVIAQNLVVNPSFEIISTVNCDANSNAADFNSETPNWTTPINTTPDIMDITCNIACFSNPYGSAAFTPGSQTPRTGSRMAHAICYGANVWYRELIQVNLSSALDTTKQYKVEFYVSLSSNYQFSSNAFEVLFTTAEIPLQAGNANLNTPQLTYLGSAITDTTNWTHIEFIFCPTEEYTHFTVGNISKNFTVVNTGFGSRGYSGYYYDDFSVTELAAPNFTFTYTDPSCGNNNGTITIHGLLPSSTYNISYDYNNITQGPFSLNSNAAGEITFTGLSAGTYTNFIIDIGCPLSLPDTIILTSASALTPTITGILSLCQGDTTMLDAGAGYSSYSWTPSGNSQTINVTTAGTYSVTVTDSSGCTGSDTVIVTVSPNLNPIITGNLSFCAGDSTTLDAGAGYSSYSWSPSGNSQTINVNTGGIYIVTVSNGGSCDGSDTVTVTVNPNPTPTITGNTILCTGDSLTLNAGNYLGYLWSTTDNSQTINVNSSGNYSVTVTDNNGCIGDDSITITENALPIITVTNDTICNGEQASLTASGASTYVWSNSSTSNPLTANPSATTTYTVTGSDNSCTGSATGIITVYLGPQAMFFVDPPDVEINEIVSFIDASIDASSWSWNFGDGNTAIGLNPTHSYTSPGSYTSCLLVEDLNGCKDSICLKVNVNQLFTFYIPNSFSPNKDGFNEIFIPKGVNIDEERYLMQIYDRWGKKVFETTDLHEGWNGSINGNIINEETTSNVFVYYFHVYENNTDIDHEYRGAIILIK